MTAPDSISVASVNLVLFAARQRGADPDALLRTAGISPDQLRDPDGRVPIRQMQSLWPPIIAATRDPDLALHIGELINPTAFGVLAYVMMHCPTLGRALDKLCQYQAIVCEGLQTVGRPADGAYELLLHLTSSDIIYPVYVLNAELSVYQSAMRAMTGRTVTAREVRFAFAQPADIREYERVFGPARLTFDAGVTAYVLDERWLLTPILNANPALFTLFEQHANAQLHQLRPTSLSAHVRAAIVRLMKGEEPTLGAVADQLAMGIRTLQLHLKHEQTTYQALLDDVRRDLAVRHLNDQTLSTTDIAYLLGFAEPSVFFRSFKKWTGQTPGAYRLARAPG